MASSRGGTLVPATAFVSMVTRETPKEAAEASFAKKQKQAEEGRAALSDYQAQAKATEEKTARLRALRLAKEAVEEALSPKIRPKRSVLRRIRQHGSAYRTRKPSDT